ncbi:hypothetical protein WR25_01043 [Diploscapter pachys]|uniref:Dolichol-phosphate mannosyltransferase subunit 3 n=1 Tax=Diploscapter pachys TaxID=2018661 RepID=A0A2A2JTB3_9BILA|nr:hypothetical protein WR25_01043 [Diploscapter pachys]
MTTQLMIYATRLLPLIAVWFAIILNILPVFDKVPQAYHWAILYAPVLAVFLFGFYAFASLVYGVATFNDCQKDRDELVKEIDEAKKELRKRKIID